MTLAIFMLGGPTGRVDRLDGANDYALASGQAGCIRRRVESSGKCPRT
jgi:hypothetical protein